MARPGTIVVAAFLAAALVACSEGGSVERAAPSTTMADGPYALFHGGEGWQLQEAVEYGPGHPLADVQPGGPVRWFAEYERFQGSTSSSLSVSGHDLPVPDVQDAIEALGWSFAPVEVEGWSSAVGAPGGEDTREPIVLLDGGGHAVQVFGGDTALRDLVRLAGMVEPATGAQWEEVGGAVVEWPPTGAP